MPRGEVEEAELIEETGEEDLSVETTLLRELVMSVVSLAT